MNEGIPEFLRLTFEDGTYRNGDLAVSCITCVLNHSFLMRRGLAHDVRHMPHDLAWLAGAALRVWNEAACDAVLRRPDMGFRIQSFVRGCAGFGPDRLCIEIRPFLPELDK